MKTAPADPTAVAAVAALAARLRRSVGPALADEDNAVHRMRTEVRRLRNLFAALGDISGSRDELKEVGDRLGEVRDLEVRIALTERLLAEAWGASAAEPQHPEGSRPAGPGGITPAEVVRTGLLAPARAAHAEAHTHLARWCVAHLGPVVDRLDSWVSDPPELPRRSPGELVEREAGRALRRARRIDVDAVAAGDATAIEQAHSARKAARRLRHVAEAFRTPPTAVLGSRARKLARRGSRLQSALGEHRDMVVLARHARDRAHRAEPRIAVEGEGTGGAAEALDAFASAAEEHGAAALSKVPMLVERLERMG